MPTNYNNNFCLNCPYSGSKHLTINYNNMPLSAELNHSKTLLVFQAPGINEWTGNFGYTNRAPIISNSSHSCAARLRNSFDRIKKYRSNYDITEVVQCYPGQNCNKRDKKPKIAAIKHCQNHLLVDVLNGKYDKIISFGSIANEVVDNILAINNLTITHIKLPHPCSGKLPNIILDNSIK